MISRWIKLPSSGSAHNYLEGRRQAVTINGTLPPENDVPCARYRVPQGSVIGPLLFTLFVAPLGSIAQKDGIDAHFHADDTQLYIRFDHKEKDAEEGAAAIMNGAIQVWMERNFVKLNGKKTDMLLSSPQMSNTIALIDVTVGRELFLLVTMPGTLASPLINH